MSDDFQNTINEIRNFNQIIFNAMPAHSKLEKLEETVNKKDKRKLAKALMWHNDGDSFDQRIFELISKAQSTSHNYYRLMMGFPDYVEMWAEWQATENEEDFFNKYEVIIKA